MVKLLTESLSELEVTVTVAPRVLDNCSSPLANSLAPAITITRLAFWWCVAKRAREEQAQVIHLFTSLTSALGVKTFIIRTLSRIPLVVHVTGLGKPKFGYKFLFRADRIIVGGSYLTRFFPGAIELPPVSPHMNRTQEAPRLALIATAPRKLLFLGAMEPVRGVHTLVDAINMLVKDYALNDFSLTIAWNGYGDRRYADSIRTRIAEYGIADRVHWEQEVRNVSALYRMHDLVVIPRASQERMGFPLRVVEAMSYGKPLVVSDVGEMPKAVEGCGTVYPREDARALAAALHRLMTNLAFYRKCVSNTQSRIEQYNPSRVASRLIELYEELTNGS